MIVYFSNVSNNTHRFVDKLGYDSLRIPTTGECWSELDSLIRTSILITPTYGNGSVPPQVVKWLNRTDRSLIKGVVGSGNTNFGKTYALAGIKVSQKLKVPLFHRFELIGNSYDIEQVKKIVSEIL